jgi:ABC-type nitrate/sulfonate/bicarbonate transport system substrate-binding protein
MLIYEQKGRSLMKTGKMIKSIISFIIIITAVLAIAACSAQKKPEALQKVTFVLDWTPNTNHTGIYVAKEKGFYKDQGLDVEIIQPQEGSSDTIVASGKAQFGISYQEGVTYARAAGVPLVSIAAVIQHNTSGFASLKEKNILSPKDFEGKTYGGWGSDVEAATIKYLMDQAGADFSEVKIMTTGDADFFQASASGQIDFAWIFEGWAGIEAKQKGIELNYIDLGRIAPVFDYYTPVIITNEDIIKNNKKLVEAFMDATIKGYEYAIENPDDAAQILVSAVPELNRELVVESQRFLSERYKDDAEKWGLQKQEVWQRYTDWMYQNGFIEENIDVTKAYTNEFIK